MINDTNRDKFEMIKHTQVRDSQRRINPATSLLEDKSKPDAPFSNKFS